MSDQLRFIYRMQRFQRNQKWWWAEFIWGYETMITNAYVMHRRYCRLKGLRQTYTHHDFRELIGLAHLDPVNEWGFRRKSPVRVAKQSPAPRCTKFTTQTLRENGALKVRLDNSFAHTPVQPNGKPGQACQLHRWASRQVLTEKEKEGNPLPSGARKNVMTCETCHVKLCLACWKTFHTCKHVNLQVNNILSNK